MSDEARPIHFVGGAETYEGDDEWLSAPVAMKAGWDRRTTWRTAMQWRAALREYWDSDGPDQAIALARRDTRRTKLAEQMVNTDAVATWRRALRDGICVWIDDEMLALARHAVSTMPMGMTLHVDQLLQPQGLLVFETPLHVLAKAGDHPEIALNVCAMGWAVANGRLYFADYEAREGPSRSRIPLPDGLTPLVVTDSIPVGSPLSESDWMMGRTYVTMLLLMAQKIAAKTYHVGDRATRRRIERKDRVVQPVTMIRLRRQYVKPPEGHEGEHREYSHRFIVSAHWREQWYPSLGEHRTIPIAAYVKGPEDKPLVLKDRGYRWDR